MPLVKCRECKREVSKQAAVCPGCGIKQPGKVPIKEWRAAVLVVAVLGGIFLIMALVAPSPEEAQRTRREHAAQARARVISQRQLMQKLEKTLGGLRSLPEVAWLEFDRGGRDIYVGFHEFPSDVRQLILSWVGQAQMATKQNTYLYAVEGQPSGWRHGDQGRSLRAYARVTLSGERIVGMYE